jgi:hypothetical protein
MTYINKILIYLGFCPSQESAKHFKIKNNESTELTHRWKPREMMTYIGVVLSFVGMIPYYFEDTSITGVTDTIILHGRLGLASFILGTILIIFGAIIPRIINKIRMIGV